MNPSLHGLQGQLQRITNSLLFTARPSGTDDGYKIYVESFRGADHLHRILEEAQSIVSAVLAAPTQQPVFTVAKLGLFGLQNDAGSHP